MSFFAELKRRHVFRVGIAYAIVAWVLIQAGAILFPTFHAPDWVMQIFTIVILLGFPVALVMAWAYELTPQGIKHTSVLNPGNETGNQEKPARRIFFIGSAALILIATGIYIAIYSYQVLLQDTQQTARAQKIVLAVLPIRDLRGGAPADNAAAGLREELLDALTSAGNWQLVSRTSGSRFQEGDVSLKEAAVALGATHVIEGSIRIQDDKWRMTAQLIEAASDTHLFSFTGSYPKEFELGDVNKTFTQSIVARTRFMLSDGEWAYPVPENEMPEKAALLFRQGIMESRYGRRAEGIRYFNEAKAIAPDNGRILAMLAYSLIRIGGNSTASETLQNIRNTLQQAEQASPGLPEIQLARAWLASYVLGEGSLEMYDSMSKELSGYYDWQLGRAFVLNGQGQHEQALLGFEQAAALDVYAFLPVANVGRLLLMMHRPDDAITYLDRARRQRPLVWNLALWSVNAHLMRYGNVEDARREIKEILKRVNLDRDHPVIKSISIQLDLLAGEIQTAADKLNQYPGNCLERYGYPPFIGRNACKSTLLPAIYAMLGNPEKLNQAARRSRLVLEDEINKSNDDNAAFNENELALAQVSAFAGDRDRALVLLEEIQKDLNSAGDTDSYLNWVKPDLAIAWLWAGDKEKALKIIAESLDEYNGAYAAIVARDPVWCPLYDEDAFTTLLERHGQELHRHDGICEQI